MAIPPELRRRIEKASQEDADRAPELSDSQVAKLRAALNPTKPPRPPHGPREQGKA